MPTLSWQVQQGKLSLTGELENQTLLPLWQWMQQPLAEPFDTLDVSGLNHVDSAGLALLLHLLNAANKRNVSLRLEGITDKLKTLITLYNLQDVIASQSTS